MQLQPDERAILVAIARRRGVDEIVLIAAIEHESAPELAAAMQTDEAEASALLAPILRLVTVNDDWGAGCAILSDEMRAELRAALRRLAQ